MPHKDKKERLEYAKQYRKDHPEEVKNSTKQWRENNPEKVKKQQRQYCKKIKKYIQNYKLSKGCAICGYDKCAAALDFHHNGKDKTIGTGQAFGSRSLENVKKEIEKCDVLCSNCHRELHYKERKEI